MIFGRDYKGANTIIGGVGATITTAALLATKLGIAASRITFFEVSGLEVRATITGTYTMAQQAFRNNTEITYFKDEDNLCIALTNYSFQNCTSFTECKLEGVVSMAEGNFNNCRVKNFNFPNLKNVGNQPFWGNPEMLSFNAPVLDNFYGSGNFFTNCTKLVTVNTPLINKLGGSHFSGCSSLVSVSYPNLVTITGNSTFLSCTSLVSVSLPLITSIVAQMFRSCSKLLNVSFPNVTSISYNTFTDCTLLNSIYFPEVTTIDTSNFNNTRLVNVSLPKIVNLNTFNFRNIQTLVTVDLPLVKNIGQYSFDNCPNLENISLSGVSTIGDYAFRGCAKLPNLGTLNYLVTVGINAFDSCSSVNFNIVDFPILQNVPNYMLFNCINVKNVNLPLANRLGDYSFFNCPQLTTLNTQEVTSVGINLFSSFGAYTMPLNSFYAPKCAVLGNTVNTDEQVFRRVKNGFQITVKSSLATVNAGAPDADLVWATTNKAAVINYVP